VLASGDLIFAQGEAVHSWHLRPAARLFLDAVDGSAGVKDLQCMTDQEQGTS